MMYRWIGGVLESEWPIVKAEEAPTADAQKTIVRIRLFECFMILSYLEFVNLDIIYLTRKLLPF